MKDELNCSYNGGGDSYLLQSVSIHFNHTVMGGKLVIIWSEDVVSERGRRLYIFAPNENITTQMANIHGASPQSKRENFHRSCLN